MSTTKSKPNTPSMPAEEAVEEQVQSQQPAAPTSEYAPNPSLPMPLQVWFDLVPNSTGKSHFLVAYHSGRPWDPTKDLTLGKTIKEGEGAIDAMAKMSTGYFTGTPKLIVVSPIGMLFYENGNGTFAYVRHDYVPGEDAITLNFNGKSVLLDVDELDVPEEGYHRLNVNCGRIVGGSQAVDWITERDENLHMWGYLRAASAMLTGTYHTRVSVGPVLIGNAREALRITQSDDPSAEFDKWTYIRRQAARARRVASEVLPTVQRDIKQAGGTAAPGSLMVGLYPEGQYNLASHPFKAPITLRNENGNLIDTKWLREDTPAERQAFAIGINSEGLLVDLRQ